MTTILRRLAATALVALLLAGCAGEDVADTSTEGGQRPGLAPTATSGSPGSPGAPGAATASDPTEAPSTDGELVDAVPLGAGWPSDVDADQPGLQLPVDAFDQDFVDGAYDPSTCALDAPTRASSAELRAQLTDSGIYLTRDLRVFDDADEASSYVGELADYYASCRPVVLNGTTSRLFRVDPGAGGQSFALVLGSLYGGEPGIGTNALLGVRVGRSVLVDTSVDDALVADEDDARTLIASMVDRAADVVAAQCALTSRGC